MNAFDLVIFEWFNGLALRWPWFDTAIILMGKSQHPVTKISEIAQQDFIVHFFKILKINVDIRNFPVEMAGIKKTKRFGRIQFQEILGGKKGPTAFAHFFSVHVDKSMHS